MAIERPFPRCCLLDLAIIVVLIVAMALVATVTGGPNIRGFNCNDYSIRYPYHEDSVGGGALMLVGIGVPIIVIIVVELLRHFLPEAERGSSRTALCGCAIHPVIGTCLCFFTMFIFGWNANMLVTEVGKDVIGRLRPHFIDVCKPDVNLVTCYGDPNAYLTNYTCQGSDAAQIQEARKSFPSGHAAFSIYGSLFVALYLQFRCPRLTGSLLLVPLLQFLSMLWAWYVGLSRYLDNKHHPTDILAGFFLGALICIATVVMTSFFADPLKDPDDDSDPEAYPLTSGTVTITRDPEGVPLTTSTVTITKRQIVTTSPE